LIFPLDSCTRCTLEANSFIPEILSDTPSLVEAMCSNVATTGSTDIGTMKPEEVLGLG